jgi:hypothetical protein
MFSKSSQLVAFLQQLLHNRYYRSKNSMSAVFDSSSAEIAVSSKGRRDIKARPSRRLPASDRVSVPGLECQNAKLCCGSHLAQQPRWDGSGVVVGAMLAMSDIIVMKIEGAGPRILAIILLFIFTLTETYTRRPGPL